MRINKLFSRLSTGALLATVVTVAANPAQAGTLTTINFDENVGVDSNPLAGGTILDNLWEKDYGLKMDSSVKKLWLYDSSCLAQAKNKPIGTSKDGFTDICTGDDPDLATGKGSYKDKKDNLIKYKSPEQGKVLIVQENDSNEADDYGKGENTISFYFTDDVGVLFNSIKLLDFDENNQPTFFAKFADGTDTRDKHKGNDKGFKYNKNWFQEIDVNNNDNTNTKNKKLDNYFEIKDGKENETYISEMKLLSTSWNGKRYVKDDNSLREYKFDFADKRVTQFSITLPGSGAVTGLNYYRENPKKLVKKVPEPTSILGLVAVSGLVASSLKRKRKSSII
jgi:hypothetical protein